MTSETPVPAAPVAGKSNQQKGTSPMMTNHQQTRRRVR